MNWLKRGRQEIVLRVRSAAAITANRSLAAATAVQNPDQSAESVASFGSNDSAACPETEDTQPALEEFEERAAIMEFDGGLTRAEAERSARSQLRQA